MQLLEPALPSSGHAIGPTLPPVTASERQLALESAQDSQRLERKAKLRDAYSRADEMVPKGVGKEGKIEEKRAINAENRVSRDKDMAAGLEADEGVLMGENEGFAAA